MKLKDKLLVAKLMEAIVPVLEPIDPKPRDFCGCCGSVKGPDLDKYTGVGFKVSPHQSKARMISLSRGDADTIPVFDAQELDFLLIPDVAGNVLLEWREEK